MEKFSDLNLKIQDQFKKMCSTGKLFIVEQPNSSISDLLWETYIKSFRKGDDPVFRDPNSTTHTCNNDKNFIRRYGNIVAIIDNKVVTMWDLDLSEDSIYYNSCKAMSELLKNTPIKQNFLESFAWLNTANYEKTRNVRSAELYRLGVEKSFKQYTKEEVSKFGVVNSETVYEFAHFHVYLPKQFVDFSNKSIESIVGELRTTRQLFEKSLNIPLDTLELVRDLIQQGSLLRGDMYLNKVLDFIKIKKQFEKLPQNERNNWMWLNYQSTPYARFANELIGCTCIELAEGKEINKVCKDFNQRVDPANYNKAKAPVTKAMIDLAEKQIIELGYADSFERRFATIEDIDVSEIKHSNIDNSAEKPVGLFAKAGVAVNNKSLHKRAEFDKVEEITIDKFMTDILPNISSMEVFFENRFDNNLVSLFTTKNKNTKNLFKWDNHFSWTYNGNLSGKSMIKENVKNAGGNVDGVLRASMIWNESGSDHSDLDLWCKQPDNVKIGYNTGYRKDRGNNFSSCQGQLDLDNTNPGSKIGIENIYFKSINNMKDGKYLFWVNQFSSRNSQGFKFEIEINGEIYNYEYNKPVVGEVKIATVTLKNGTFEISHNLPHTNSNKTIWNIETNQFHKVNLVCCSPNHWLDNNIGTKEYFFMLQDCKTDSPMRAFHVDQLNSELMSVRKAIDMLGNYKMAEPTDKQLSGVGFNSTVRDELIVKVKGTHQRVLKIKF